MALIEISDSAFYIQTPRLKLSKIKSTYLFISTRQGSLKILLSQWFWANTTIIECALGTPPFSIIIKRQLIGSLVKSLFGLFVDLKLNRINCINLVPIQRKKMQWVWLAFTKTSNRRLNSEKITKGFIVCLRSLHNNLYRLKIGTFLDRNRYCLRYC